MKQSEPIRCVKCGSDRVVRNGKRNNKQSFLCKRCGRSFVVTSESAIERSHSSKSIWKQVIRDTVEGISIDKTSEKLQISHTTIFNMRHKILFCLEREIERQDIHLDGVHEADETFILECVKGKKIPSYYHREPRKHGAVSSIPGLSREYLCVCTSVSSENKCTAKSINRAHVLGSDITNYFGDKVNSDTVLICDGNPAYNVLEDKCTVARSNRINRVNGFHSFIKDRIRKARGVATTYLNRYNALFSEVYYDLDGTVEKIYELMTKRCGSFSSIETVKSEGLLKI